MSEVTDTCLAGLEPAGLRDALRSLRPSQVVCHGDGRLSIAANRVRGFIGDAPFVAVSGAVKRDEQVRGFIDAVYWRLTQAPTSRLQYFIGRSSSTDQVLQALASLNDLLAEDQQVVVHVDGERATLRRPDFSGEKAHWLELLRARDQRLAQPPGLVTELAARVDHPDFRWHLTVHAPRWSGRLGGLRVCEVALDGSRGKVGVGKPGSSHVAARAFREVAVDGPFDFNAATLDSAVAVIRGLASRRADLGDPEHRLEDQILREQVKLAAPQTGQPLRPALVVSQFPAVWWEEDGGNRYTDLLLKEGAVPWVVEVKVATKGQGQAYRHAIGQVALYRTFIRGARGLWPWFDERSLDPRQCHAAIAFPALHGGRAKALSHDLRRVASAFDVAVFELPPESSQRGWALSVSPTDT